MENHGKNVYQRLFPDPFLTLVNNPKSHYMQEIKKEDILKEDYQKALRKLISFFLSNPVLFNGQSYLKQKGSGTSDQLLFGLQYKFRKIPLLVIYLNKFDDITKSGFWVIPKIAFANLCKPIHDIIYYSSSICLFVSGKCGKEGRKGNKYNNVTRAF